MILSRIWNKYKLCDTGIIFISHDNCEERKWNRAEHWLGKTIIMNFNNNFNVSLQILHLWAHVKIIVNIVKDSLRNTMYTNYN